MVKTPTYTFDCTYKFHYVKLPKQPKTKRKYHCNEDIDKVFDTCNEFVGDDWYPSKVTAVFKENLVKIQVYHPNKKEYFSFSFSNYEEHSFKHIILRFRKLSKHFPRRDDLYDPICNTICDGVKHDSIETDITEDLLERFSIIPKNTQEKKADKIFAEFRRTKLQLKVVFNDSRQIELDFYNCGEWGYYPDIADKISDYVEHAFDPPPSRTPSPTPSPVPTPTPSTSSTPTCSPCPSPIPNTETQEEEKEKTSCRCVLL